MFSSSIVKHAAHSINVNNAKKGIVTIVELTCVFMICGYYKTKNILLYN